MISGDAEHLRVHRIGESQCCEVNEPETPAVGAHVGADAAGDVEPMDLVADARLGLVGMGWKPAIANAAVAAAQAAVGAEAPLEALIFEALRRCRRT